MPYPTKTNNITYILYLRIFFWRLLGIPDKKFLVNELTHSDSKVAISHARIDENFANYPFKLKLEISIE